MWLSCVQHGGLLKGLAESFFLGTASAGLPPKQGQGINGGDPGREWPFPTPPASVLLSLLVCVWPRTPCLAKIRARGFWDKQPSLMSPKGRLSPPPQRNSHQSSGSVLIADVAVGCGPQLVSQDYLNDGFTPATHGARDFKYCNSPWQT